MWPNRIFFLILIVSNLVDAYSQGSPPNILWIISEDMSQDQACYGNPLVLTPTIDQLAAEGMRFTHMFTAAGVCSPSRTALAVGMYQNGIGAMHMRYSDDLKPPLPNGVKTVAQILHDHGYQTVGGGKDDYMFHLEDEAFDFESMDEIDPNKPFFAKINSFYTHRIFKKDSVHPIDPGEVSLPPYYPDVGPLREDWAAYLENIQLLDREVHDILARFETLGLLDNTIIFFLSDHGRPTLKGKYWMYDSGTKIPFIIKIPQQMQPPKGFKRGGVSDQLLSSIDISATTLALAGIQKPEFMQGRIFLGDHLEEEREFVFSALDRIGGVHFKTRAVRSNKYRYIKNFNNGLSILECSTEYRKARLPYYHTMLILDTYNKLEGVEKTLVRPLPLEELYDLHEDPFEVNNLAYSAAHSHVRGSLEKELTAWIEEIDDKGFYPDSPEIQEHFIRYRQEGKEKFRGERLASYLKIEKALKAEMKF